jgi:ribose 5-phosphate isomerase A
MTTTPLTQDELKALVGQAALQYVVPGDIVGVGTGSTVNKFIDALAGIKDQIKGAVSSSVASTERLQALGIPGVRCQRGGSLCRSTSTAPTRSTARATWSRAAVRCADAREDRGGAGAPLCVHCRRVQAGGYAGPLSVAGGGDPHGTQRIARQFAALGGTGALRLKDGQPLVTDNGQHILDVTGLSITDPLAFESR